MKFILPVAAIAFFFAACSNNNVAPETKTTFDINAVKNHIIEMNKTYGERFLTNDTAFYNSRYCLEAEVYSPQLPSVKGRDSIRAFFYQNGTNKEAKIELPAGNIYGSEELVVEEGRYNFPDGKGGSFDKGKFIALWKKEDGKWKLFREIWNTDLMPEKK
jgi:ketosteroid isomerase-like protein